MKECGNYPGFIRKAMKTAGDMWTLGWCEANGGNISVRLDAQEVEQAVREGFDLEVKSDWVPVGVSLPDLGGERFLISGTTRQLRNIALFPERNLGVIELDRAGENYRLLWGYEPEGKPTSELPAHLRSHSVAKRVSNGVDHVVIHTHSPNLIALTYLHEWNTALLSKLLWQSHVECVVGFPAGVEFIPWMMAGGDRIAEATARAFAKRSLAMWQHHGVFARGRNLDAAFGLIHMADKAAGIYLKAMSAGGMRSCPPTEVVKKIAANFGVVPAEDCIDADTAPLMKR